MATTIKFLNSKLVETGSFLVSRLLFSLKRPSPGSMCLWQRVAPNSALLRDAQATGFPDFRLVMELPERSNTRRASVAFCAVRGFTLRPMMRARLSKSS